MNKTEQLQQDLERAATSLLTDDEIIATLGITQAQLDRHYDTVERARLKLKQRLNAKRISDAANNGDPASILAEIPRNNKQKISSRGGARPGAGRPRGSQNKISGATILASIENTCGQPLEELLAQGYYESIQNNDKHTRIQYEKLFLSKVVADQVSVDVNEGERTLEAKRELFTRAVSDIINKT